VQTNDSKRPPRQTRASHSKRLASRLRGALTDPARCSHDLDEGLSDRPRSAGFVQYTQGQDFDVRKAALPSKGTPPAPSVAQPHSLRPSHPWHLARPRWCSPTANGRPKGLKAKGSLRSVVRLHSHYGHPCPSFGLRFADALRGGPGLCRPAENLPLGRNSPKAGNLHALPTKHLL
jgi:hypothetical protein